MREVTLKWDKESLASTSMAKLDTIVSKLSILGNLLITPQGVRQILLPEYREGFGHHDLNTIDFFAIEEHELNPNGKAIVVFNTHPLVLLAASTSNIHIMVPCEYEDGNFTITLRGIPQAVATFVRMSEAIIPTAMVKVNTLMEGKNEWEDHLTTRQVECFSLASELGYYEQPKRINIQGLSEVMGIARSTFQEHLRGAEQASLHWISQQWRRYCEANL